MFEGNGHCTNRENCLKVGYECAVCFRGALIVSLYGWGHAGVLGKLGHFISVSEPHIKEVESSLLPVWCELRVRSIFTLLLGYNFLPTSGVLFYDWYPLIAKLFKSYRTAVVWTNKCYSHWVLFLCWLDTIQRSFSRQVRSWLVVDQF